MMCGNGIWLQNNDYSTSEINAICDEFVFNSAQFIVFETPILIPSLAAVKCTSFATGAGADIAANWYGKNVTSPV